MRHAVGPARPEPLPADSLITITVTALHTKIDLGENFSLKAVFAATRNLTVSYAWQGLPPECGTTGLLEGSVSGHVAASPADTPPVNVTLRCHPGAVFSGRVFLNASNASVAGRWSANETLVVSAPPTVAVQSRFLRGNAPLNDSFFANVSGGSPPLAISWISTDGAIASGVWFNHTFASAGNWIVDLWVNDSTASFNPTGNFSTVLFVNVTPAPPVRGLFGLPGHEGDYLVAVVIAIVAVALLYEAATGRRARQLPPAERWMRPVEPAPPAPPPARGPPRPPPSS